MATKKKATVKKPTEKLATDKKKLKRNILQAIERQLNTSINDLAAGSYGRPDNGGYYTRPD